MSELAAIRAAGAWPQAPGAFPMNHRERRRLAGGSTLLPNAGKMPALPVAWFMGASREISFG
jgi:hypothetical protein